MNNTARVCTIESVRPHPNADRLQIASVNSFQVIVGLDTKPGDLGIFFNEGLQLSQEFASSNNLIRIRNEDGTYSGGMFDTNRRVRAMNLRGVKSEGFWCPIDYASFIAGGVEFLTKHGIGYEFVDIGTVPICNKYITPATAKAAANAAAQKKVVKKVLTFPEHIDTEQWRYAVLPTSGIVYITEKLHGTSGRYGNVKVDRKLSWWESLLMRLGVKLQTHEYTYLMGTRRVVMNGPEHAGYYGNEQFRYNAVTGIKLHEGEVLYFELVGYTTDSRPIMGTHDTSTLKEVKKKYGNTITYSYGTVAGNCDLYVYRITQHGVELSRQDVKRRCNELGIKYVPELASMSISGHGVPYSHDEINTIVAVLVDGNSTLDSTHIREGVCIRVESDAGMKVYKEKSYTFKVLEGIIKTNDDYVDTEESA